MLARPTSAASDASLTVGRPAAAASAAHPWWRERVLPLLLRAIALPITSICAWKTLDWLPPGGRRFPGFFVMETRFVPTVGLFHWTGLTHHMPFAARIRAVDGRPVQSNGDVYAYVETL